MLSKISGRFKREIINSIYPEKLVFDGFNYQTARLNEAVELIYMLGEGFSENENGQTESNFDLSTFVPTKGIEPCLPQATAGLLAAGRLHIFVNSRF